jgi:hypothetical protein
MKVFEVMHPDGHIVVCKSASATASTIQQCLIRHPDLELIVTPAEMTKEEWDELEETEDC